MTQALVSIIGAMLLALPSHAAQLQTAATPVSAAEDEGSSRTAPVPDDYIIGKGDVLALSVWGEPQLTGAATVRPDGKISILLVGDVLVAGLSVREAQDLVSARLGDFIKHPAVAVQVSEVHSKLVYVTGEVERPGAYALIDKITVVQLVARAGGVTEFAKSKRVYILRRDGGKRVPYNLKQALEGRSDSAGPELAVGDTVVVP